MVYIGNDILRIERIKLAIEKQGDIFIKRVFTEDEINYCESKNINKYQSYAARFCAKEAIYKALSFKMNQNYNWNDIEILNYENGKPYVNFKGTLKEITKDIKYSDISLSHEGEYAIANYICQMGE